jgi:trehalose 6-phosphate phosphatase
MLRHLFGPEGRHALDSVMRRDPLLAFDFDGTLAPTVARPDDARVPIALARRLARLSQVRPVAVVSGRRADDVAKRLQFEPRYLVGNHGAEDAGRATDPGALAAMTRLRVRLTGCAASLRAAGVQVEDKGLSVALHYRLAADRARALAAIEQALAGLDGSLQCFGGKCVVNAMPAGVPDKGEIVVALLARARAGALVFVGDDASDEAVFRRAEASWLTVRIGRDNPRSSARFFLDGHADVAPLLQAMLEHLATC